MERFLYSLVLATAMSLAIVNWLRPGTTDELLKLVGLPQAQAQAESTDPRSSNPIQYRPVFNTPTAPSTPIPPPSWAAGPVPPFGYSPTAQQQQNAAPNNAAPANPSDPRLAANAPLFGPPPPVQTNPPGSTYPPQYGPPVVVPSPTPPASPYAPPTPAPGFRQQEPSAAQPGYPYAPRTEYPATGAPAFNSANLPATTQPNSIESKPTTLYQETAVEGSQILAKIGDSELILLGDVLGMVNERLDPLVAAGKVPAADADKYRQVMVRQFTEQLIETKMIFADAKRAIPAANYPKVEEKMKEEFEKTRIKELMKVANVTSRSELEERLRKNGSSIEKQRAMFMEKNLAMGWMQQQIKIDEEVRHEDMLAYYHQHAAEYEFIAKARWEQLTARFDKFPSKGDAFREIANWGNEVLKGRPFAEIAKTVSQGPTANEGGQRDWTSQGSLSSEALDQALFSLPIGGMSQIIEDPQGFHIVRVVERQAAGRKSFEEMQPEIKKKIKEDRRKKQIEEYMAKLKTRTQVVTMWDPPAGTGGNLMSERPGSPIPR